MGNSLSNEDIERVRKNTGREIKKIIPIQQSTTYEKILDKSHLVFIIDYIKDVRSKQYIIYVEEKISCFDNYISHSNTNSFVVHDQNGKTKNEGILIGSKENNILLSFKCNYKEIIIDKERIIYTPKSVHSKKVETAQYPIKRIQIVEMKKTTEEIEEENKKKEEDNKATNKLDRYSMMVISKYFNYVSEYIKLEKTCKEYNGIIEQFKYNPIPFKNEKERVLFKNIETYHFYEEKRKEAQTESNEEISVLNDSRIKQFIHWRISYSYWKENQKENHIHKNIEFREEDMKKYLFNHEGKGENNWDKKMYSATENVTLEKGITSIANFCFYECYTLNSINIPTSVTFIGDSCFHSCYGLTNVVIPTSVVRFGNSCFSECVNLNEINIPSSVSSLGNVCFWNCSNLSTINIPSTVKSIGNNCFIKCSHLINIDVEEGNSIYYKEENMIKKKETEELVYYIGCNTMGEITIPTSVSSICDYCFLHCFLLNTINIPTNVKSIGNGCFSLCVNLRRINIPSSVSYLGNYCFDSCTKLSSINIPGGINSIPKYCFNGCWNLKTINIPSNVTFIGKKCFSGCDNLSDVEIEEGNSIYYQKENNVCCKEGNIVYVIFSLNHDIVDQ